MHSTLRFWLLLAAMVIPATVLIGQQWSLGSRLASLEVYERDSRARRAVDGFVLDMLEAYHAQNRRLHRRLIEPIKHADILYNRVPPSFELLAEVQAELGRPPMLFIARPVGGTFSLQYYALDNEDNLLPFLPERTLEPIHRAVLTYVHGMVDNEAFRTELSANAFYGSSEQWPKAAVHFFHVPLYFDDPVEPRAYAGFWERVDFAFDAFVLPFLRSERLADRLKGEGLDPSVFQVVIGSTDGTTLYESPRAKEVDPIVEVRLSAYGSLFETLTLRLSTIRSLVAPAKPIVRRQNVLLLALAVLWFAVAAFMLVRSAGRDRWVAQMHRDFVGRVSHELKTPVAVMLNAIETLDNPKLQGPDERRRCVEMLRLHVRELSVLLDRMMAVCRLDTDRTLVAPQAIDLADHLRDSLPRLCDSVGLPWSRVRLDVAEGTNAYVDPTAIDLILRNLLDNVVKHARAEPDSPVEVACSADRKNVRLSVRDHGVGLSAKEGKRIFRRFYRVADGLRMDTAGHGLGLSLVKSLVEAHGGRVSVENAAGEGCVFRVQLPKEPA